RVRLIRVREAYAVVARVADAVAVLVLLVRVGDGGAIVATGRHSVRRRGAATIGETAIAVGRPRRPLDIPVGVGALRMEADRLPHDVVHVAIAGAHGDDGPLELRLGRGAG